MLLLLLMHHFCPRSCMSQAQVVHQVHTSWGWDIGASSLRSQAAPGLIAQSSGFEDTCWLQQYEHCLLPKGLKVQAAHTAPEVHVCPSAGV